MQVNGDLVVREMTRCIDTYIELDSLLSKGQDAETIHDFRVASRNLLAISSLIHDAYVAVWAADLKKRLKKLNLIRDLQVLRELIGHEDRDIASLLDKQIAHRLAEWLQQIQSNSEDVFLRSLEQSADLLRTSKGFNDNRFVSDARYQCDMAQTKLEQRLDALDPSNPKSFHRLRIAYKTIRYLVSFLHHAGLIPALEMEKVKYWQDRLGEIQDNEVALLWLIQHCPRKELFIASKRTESEHLREVFYSERNEFRRFATGLCHGIERKA